MAELLQQQRGVQQQQPLTQAACSICAYQIEIIFGHGKNIVNDNDD